MHIKTCLAVALTCAIENLRDDETITDEHFVEEVQDAFNLYTIAEGYLMDEMLACKCPDGSDEKPCLFGRPKSQCQGLMAFRNENDYHGCDDCRAVHVLKNVFPNLTIEELVAGKKLDDQILALEPDDLDI